MKYLFIIMISFNCLSQEEFSFTTEHFYAPNSSIYVNDSLDENIIVSEIYSDVELLRDYESISNDFINELLTDVSFDNEREYKYYIQYNHTIDLNTKELFKNKMISIYRNLDAVKISNYELISFSDIPESFDGCNNNYTNIIDTKLISSLGDFGILKRDFQDNTSLIEVIYVDCTFVRKIDLDSENIKSKKLKNRLVILYDDKDFVLIH